MKEKRVKKELLNSKAKNKESLSEEEKAEIRLDIKLKLLSTAFNVLVFSGIGLCALLYGKYIECVILLVAFISLRYCFPTTYHSKSFWMCLLWSIMIFVVALPNVLPIGYSLLCGVIVGCVVDFILYKIQEFIDLKEFYTERTTLTLETITEEELTRLCKNLHYKQYKIDLAIKFFVHKWSNRQVWEYMCQNKMNVDWDSVIKIKYRISKDLKKHLNK